ncbi:hypothetical protein F8M41_018350 [Gigaspora margarita]|uniref:Uncharacterized protein n=1 Tax=Gigaspora margarita TaxID=4874 RepID=A0A8H4ALP2_GIGMA|nr:hypothetical protein F8M41_018350 [Gigaspora margarita]
MNLLFMTTQLVIDRFHLIASQKGERLLYIAGGQYNLMDPYSLETTIDASDLFENIEEDQIQEPYIIRSDKIIYFIDGKLSIKELAPVNSDDWIKFLRKEFGDKQKLKLKDLSSRFENLTSGRILPASSYETIIKNLDIKFGDKELFNVFLKSNIKDKFYLTCYGKDLMKTLIEQKDDKWIRYLGHNCINKCLQRVTVT